MSAWLESKYINLMSNQFSVFKRKSDKLYNVRCPDCGDSTKNKFKARGYFYLREGKWFYKCHNCGYGTNLSNFMKKHAPLLYKEFMFELLSEGETKGEVLSEPESKNTPITTGLWPLKKLSKISSLLHSHSAKIFIKDRMIPNPYHASLFYTSDFTNFVNDLIPEKLKEGKRDPRVIIPFIDKKKNLYGFQGRSISKDSIRYITILLDESKPKIYGLDKVDYSKPVYVFEGPFDSMFIPNSIAVCGSDIIQALSQVPELNKDNTIIVYDNEPRSETITKKIDASIGLGYRVCVWPSFIAEKDINDMIMSGMQAADLKLIIDNNSKKDLEAKLALSAYRR
jgi:hypothetical protein